MGPKFYLQFMFLTICAWLYVGVDNNWGQFNKTFRSVIYMPIDFMSKTIAMPMKYTFQIFREHFYAW